MNIHSLTGRAATMAGAGVLVAAGAVGIATVASGQADAAASPSASSTSSPDANGQPAAPPLPGKHGTTEHGPGSHDPGKHGPGLRAWHGLRAALHGEAVVPHRDSDGKVVDGQYDTVVYQRGSVTAVSSSSISVKSPDGYTATYAVTSNTHVHKDGKIVAVTDLTVGDTVRVAGTRSGTTTTAKRIDSGRPKLLPPGDRRLPQLGTPGEGMSHGPGPQGAPAGGPAAAGPAGTASPGPSSSGSASPTVSGSSFVS